MTDHDPGDPESGVHSHLNSGHPSGVESASDAMGPYGREEYPAVVASEAYPMHAGPCAPYYGQGPMGYTDYPDRYSVGYQRMGQTITLTSHKIQFGCQGNPNSGFPNQRCSGPSLRHQYHMIPPVGKTWIEPCQERSQSNTKSNNRGRTTYSDDQIAELESVFNSNPYPTSQTRQRLAYKIDVPEGKVKIWFQNRRARAKKSKLSCGVPWRTTINSTSNSLEERGNQNNNNAKEMSNKSNPEANIPIAAILPLPTKTSITNSALVSCVPAWRGYYDASMRNPSCGRSYHQNMDCSMHGSCSCSDMTTHYPIRVDADRFMPTARSVSSSMCHENRSYTANGLRSPPPIRRLIYPFHTLTQKSMKAERDHDIAQEAQCSSRGVYAFADSNADSTSLPSRLYLNSAIPVVNPATMYSELRQCTTADWDSGQSTSGASNYAKAMASDVESGFGRDLIQSCAVASRSSGRRENISASVEGFHSAGLPNCSKTENVVGDAKASLSLAENAPADRLWNDSGCSNILIKAMECAQDDSNIEKPPSSHERGSGQTGADASGSDELSAIWPTHFSGSICAPAPPSIVG